MLIVCLTLFPNNHCPSKIEKREKKMKMKRTRRESWDEKGNGELKDERGERNLKYFMFLSPEIQTEFHTSKRFFQKNLGFQKSGHF